MNKIKKSYPEDAKTMFGVATMGCMNIGAQAFMTSLFMLYLTDYSGIGAIAAKLGTILLLIGRIVDAVNDPLQGWIMDNTKPTKWGKYKPFVILSIILTAISITLLYSIPQFIIDKTVLVVIWMLVFYLMYDFGASFCAIGPLTNTLTTDPVIRAKYSAYSRIVEMFAVIPFSFFIAMVTGINRIIGNMKTSFSLITLMIVIPLALLSLIGVSCVKEGKHKITDEEKNKFGLREFVNMLKVNRPFQVFMISYIFTGFVWPLIYATITYYIKWAYCVDLSTGLVDSSKFGLLTAIAGALQMFPAIFAAILSPKLIKKYGSPIQAYRAIHVFIIISCVLLFICQIFGWLRYPILYFILLGILLFSCGLPYVPGQVIGQECLDYAYYKTGRTMGGMLNSVTGILIKAQNALSSALVGAILIAIGYQVDSTTDTFVGELSSIPWMLTMFIFVSTILPVGLLVCSLIALKFYPITNEEREKMRAELEKRNI